MKAILAKGSLGIGEAEYPVDILVANLDGDDITIISTDNETYVATHNITQKLVLDAVSTCEVDIPNKLAKEVNFSIEVKNKSLNVRAQKDLRNFIKMGGE